jgi:hypothetical protein
MVPESFPYPINQIVIVPIDDLYDPDWNPRPVIEEGPLQDLIAYIEKGGYTPALWVWVGNGKKPWAVIAGKRRREAFRRLGKNEIEVQFMDCTEEEAIKRAHGSNQDKKPFWLNEYMRAEAVQGEHSDWSYAVVAADMGKRKDWVGDAILTTKLLSKASRKLIFDQYFSIVGSPDDSEKTDEITENIVKKDQKKIKKTNITVNKRWFLTESVVLELLPLLRGRLEIEAVRLADQAIPLILSSELKGPQVKKLVTSQIQGKSIDEITEILKTKPPKSGTGADSPISGEPVKRVESVEPALSPVGSSEPGSLPLTTTQNKSPWGERLGQVWKGFKEAAIKTIFGKIPKSPWEAVGMLCWNVPIRFLKTAGKYIGKAASGLWHRLLKYVHQACKAAANWVVPLRHSSSSHSQGGTGRGKTPSGSWATMRFTGFSWRPSTGRCWALSGPYSPLSVMGSIPGWYTWAIGPLSS